MDRAGGNQVRLFGASSFVLFARFDVFEQLKIYFVHAADDKIKLWSLSYQDAIFHFWREAVLNIEPKFQDKETYQQDIVTFYWTFKYKLEEILDAVKKIQDSHKINRKNIRYNSGENPNYFYLGANIFLRSTQKVSNPSAGENVVLDKDRCGTSLWLM
ncbi:uncharacterized protein EV154DRAFT_256664 [Mucor mucedo]|uniref:uncharacterized protein n=1 Tax=Mucor mucedo TaxID=29922 RepID=UPI00221FEC2E|nr:uncharacterized protein EV154DRAFT_256664 [Mucor mucedo]KAI7890157.1 hypothetical protein EV154DRAFT_256664 [Mucor mucedo]